MSVKEAEASTVENMGAQKQPGFGRKLLNHYKKWWWAHLIFLCASVLIITLCLVYVGFPRIAQDQVNDSTLTVKSQTVSDPTPHSVHLHIDSISNSDSVFHPALDSFPAKLYLSHDDISDSDDLGPSFGTITIPSGYAGPDNPVTIDQTMEIKDMDAFTKYNIQVLKSEKFQMLISGDMTLHEEAFPATTTNFDKVVTMKGLNGLKGLDITSLKTTKQQHYNLAGEVVIPNPSVFTIVMGTVTTDLFIDDTNVGTNTLEDVVLKPGNNTISMKGHTLFGPLFTAVKKGHYHFNKVPLTIKGKSSVYKGKEIPYYSAALQSNPLKVNVDLTKVT